MLPAYKAGLARHIPVKSRNGRPMQWMRKAHKDQCTGRKRPWPKSQAHEAHTSVFVGAQAEAVMLSV